MGSINNICSNVSIWFYGGTYLRMKAKVNLKRIFEDFCLEVFSSKEHKDLVAIQLIGINKNKTVAGSVYYRTEIKGRKKK